MENCKTALITGASQGLGAEIAKRLAKDGFNVLINCRNDKSLENGETIAAECSNFGIIAKCFVADVSNFDECSKMVEFAQKNFNSIDCLINNAGITKDGLIAFLSPEDFDVVTKVNYYSVYNMTKLVSKIMIKQKSGRIVNVSSVTGINGNAGQFNYSASKAGIIGMTKSAAKELGSRGILVNAVAPGFIQTQMTASLPSNLVETIKKLIAIKRFGEPKEVASVVSFLCSEDSSYVNGQVIKIDGCLAM